MNEPDVEPCVIVPTRYGGAYEGGRWAAFPGHPSDIAKGDWDAGDAWAAAWWRKHGTTVGVGDSPQAAYEALKAIPPDRRWSSERSGFTKGL